MMLIGLSLSESLALDLIPYHTMHNKTSNNNTSLVEQLHVMLARDDRPIFQWSTANPLWQHITNYKKPLIPGFLGLELFFLSIPGLT
jgi:hypothetical protein